MEGQHLCCLYLGGVFTEGKEVIRKVIEISEMSHTNTQSPKEKQPLADIFFQKLFPKRRATEKCHFWTLSVRSPRNSGLDRGLAEMWGFPSRKRHFRVLCRGFEGSGRVPGRVQI